MELPATTTTVERKTVRPQPIQKLELANGLRLLGCQVTCGKLAAATAWP